MKKILIIADYLIITAMIQILNDMGLDKSMIDTASTLEKMLSMIEGNSYQVILSGLRKVNDEQMLGTVKVKGNASFIFFCDLTDTSTVTKMYLGGVKGLLSWTAGPKEISIAIQKLLEEEIYIC